MKRKIAILLSAMMVTSAMPLTANAAALKAGSVISTAFSKANEPIDANAFKSMPKELTNADLENRQSVLKIDLVDTDLSGPIQEGTSFTLKLENGTFDNKYLSSYQYINSVNGKAVDLASGKQVKDLTTFFENSIKSIAVPMGYNTTIDGTGTANKTSIASLTVSSELKKLLDTTIAYVSDSNNISGQKVYLSADKSQEVDLTSGTLDNFIQVLNAANGTNHTKESLYKLAQDEWNVQQGKLTTSFKGLIPYKFDIVSPTEAKVTISTDITNNDSSVYLSEVSNGLAKVTGFKFYKGGTEVNGTSEYFTIANIKALDNISLLGSTDGKTSEGYDTVKNAVKVSPMLLLPLGGVVADTDAPVKVTVEGNYTDKINKGEYNLTKNEGSSTNFDYPEKNIKYFEDYVNLDPIVIKENSRNTIGKTNDKNKATVTLRLNSGFEFKGSLEDYKTKLKVYNDANPTAVDSISVDTESIKINDNGSSLTFNITLPKDRSNPMGLRIVMLQDDGKQVGLPIQSVNEKQFGDVTLTVSGDGISSQTKTVAKREALGFELKTVADPKDIISGRHYYPNKFDASGKPLNSGTMIEADNNTVEIQFAEKVPNTLVSSRSLDFTVPEGVKIVDAYIDNSSVKYITGLNNDDFEITNNGRTLRLKRDTYQVKSSVASNSVASFKFKLDLSVDPAFSGKINLSLTGGGQSDAIETTIANAVVPFTIETANTKANLGYQDYNTADITITEAKPGMFLQGKDASLRLVAPYGDSELGFSGAQFEISGDELNIKPSTFKVDKGVIKFSIDRASYKNPASLKIKNVKVGANRSVPFGAYNLALGGDAIINNYSDKVNDDKSFSITGQNANLYNQDNTSYYKFDNYVEIITETGTFDKTVKVSVGEKTVLIGDQVVDMDVAPYIQASSNSTMVPLRFVSVALGVDSANASNPDASNKIVWDQNSKTATIYYGAGTGQKIIQFQAGSNIMTVDGTRIPMEFGVKAEIKDNRMFVPFRALGQALGVTVAWDADTRTAIYNEDNGRNLNAGAISTTAATTASTTTESTTATTTESTTASDSTTETTTAKQ